MGKKTLHTWSHFGNLFSTDFVSFSLGESVLHSVSQLQVVQVSTHFTEEKSDTSWDLDANSQASQVIIKYLNKPIQRQLRNLYL